MLCKAIKFEDVNGKVRVENFHFNMTKEKFLKMKMESLEIDRIIEENKDDPAFDAGKYKKKDILYVFEQLKTEKNILKIYDVLRDLVTSCYGVVKGESFIQNQDTKEAFEHHPACAELMFGFLANPEEIGPFFEKVLPYDCREDFAKAQKEANKVVLNNLM